MRYRVRLCGGIFNNYAVLFWPPELDREAKLEALVTALEVQEARMLALAERFQAHCVGFQKSVGGCIGATAT